MLISFVQSHSWIFLVKSESVVVVVLGIVSGWLWQVAWSFLQVCWIGKAVLAFHVVFFKDLIVLLLRIIFLLYVKFCNTYVSTLCVIALL